MSWGLALWIPLAGIVALVALTILPAALITALKGRSDLFGWGFLTFGITWFGGALLLAPPDSNWSHRFYSEEQRRRAGLPFFRQQSRRTFVAWAAAGIGLVVVVGAFVLRPTPVLGVDGEALGASLPHRSEVLPIGDPLGPCEHERGNLWTCDVVDPELSGGTIPYAVRVGPLGCWTATPVRAAYESYGRFTGCVSVIDYLWY